MNNSCLADVFSDEKIEYFAPVPIEKCRVRRSDVISSRGIAPESIRTAIMFLIPYYVDDGVNGNISLYARSLDYHFYCEELFPRLCGTLEKKFGGRFIGFADKSPIEEADAASRAGLGKIGDSYVIINEKYGSFVFIGEILTDIAPEAFGCSANAVYEPSYCDHCGACRAACPMTKDGGECLSAVTQKKGELSEDEKEYIIKHKSAWGCDICQLACPLVQSTIKNGAQTPIEFFYHDRIARLDSERVNAMTDGEFSRRAFSWRGKNTILRNLSLFETDKEQ